MQLRHSNGLDYMTEKPAAFMAWDVRLREITEGATASNIVELRRGTATNSD